jgi:putative ABC transport system permease protein
MGILASMAAALVPARRASRLDIAGELADHSRRHDASPRVSSRRAIVLSALTALGLALAWIGARDGSLERWQPNAILAGIMLAFVCGFALPPALAPAILRRLAKMPVLDRGPARVAMAGLVSETRRTSAVLMAVGAAVGMSFTLGNVFPGMALGARDITRQTAYDRVMVTTLPPNNSSGIDAKIAPDVQDALAGLPGVAALEHQYHANMDFPGVGSVGLTATDGMVARFPLYDGVDGTTAFARGQVMLGPALARDLSLRPGDTFTVPGRYGPRDLVVGGIWQAPDELGRSISMRVPQFQQIAGVHPPDWLMLVPQPGVTPAELAHTVRAANLADNLKVFDPAALEVEYTSNFKGFLTPFWLLARGLLAVAFVATVSTLLLSGVQRRREHGLLAAVGMGPGDLGRMVLVEAGIIGVVGTVLGALCGAVGLAAFSLASASLTGLAIPFRLSVAPLLLYGGIATACVVAGAAFPAWRTSRLNPVTALRYE